MNEIPQAVANWQPEQYLPGMNDDRRATHWRSPDEPCLNCGDTTPGRYCPTCGQRKTEVLVSVRTMLADVLEDQLVLNRALPRTIGGLLFRPGFLTQEYVRGRIVRYIAPFRLYLVASIIFFLMVSFVGLRGFDVNIDDTGTAARDSVRAAYLEQGADSAQADSAAAALARLDTTELAPGGIQPWAREIQFNSNQDLLNRALRRKLGQVAHLPIRDAVSQILRDMLEYAPHMIFLLLPLYAFLLKLLYIRRSRYYAEHFVFALHVHAFFFVIFTIMFIMPWGPVDLLLVAWAALYVWLALKRVYAQGWIRTTLKWWTLGVCYFFLVTFALAGLTMVTLLLT